MFQMLGAHGQVQIFETWKRMKVPPRGRGLRNEAELDRGCFPPHIGNERLSLSPERHWSIGVWHSSFRSLTLGGGIITAPFSLVNHNSSDCPHFV